MRRTTTLLAIIGLAILLSAGTALAAKVICDGGVCRGTKKADNLRGSLRVDRMYGFSGNDIMSGNRARDMMRGGNGFDSMQGDYGNDRMYGNAQNDTMRGGASRDRMFGGSGRDALYGEAGADYIVVAGDGESDSIECGTGSDTAIIDAVADMNRATLIDFIQVTSCEQVILR